MLVKVFCLFRFSSSCIVLFPSNFLSFRFICFGLDLERRGFPRCLVIFRCLFMFNNQEPKIWCKAWSSWVVRCLLTVRVSVRWSGQAISLAISDVFSGFLPLGLADSIDTFQSSAGQRRPGQQLGPEGLWWWWDRWKESQHQGAYLFTWPHFYMALTLTSAACLSSQRPLFYFQRIGSSLSCSGKSTGTGPGIWLLLIHPGQILIS